MNRLKITHVTGFHYDGEVTTSYNEARMLPVSSDHQLVVSAALDIAPVSSHHNYRDYWGTRVSTFEVLAPHSELSITANSVVEVRRPEVSTTRVSIAGQRDRIVATTATVEQLSQTWLTIPPPEVIDLAENVVARDDDVSTAARVICGEIREAVSYVQGVTGVHTSASDAWEQREGVCQDIAHLAIGALRSVGIPARYVSGYLHPVPDAQIGETVEGESHAWVEWFSGDRWVGFDPTNSLEIGQRHVLIGHGRDYNDVAPLRGVFAGSKASTLFVNVTVTRQA